MLSAADWLIIAVLGVSTVVSVWRGFVREALSLLTWIAAGTATWFLAPPLSTLLEFWIETPSLRLGLAGLLLFMSILIAGGVLNNMLAHAVRFTGLAGFDRFLGMIFGFARGALIVVVAVAGIYYLAPVREDDWWRSSKLIPPIVAVIEKYGPSLRERLGLFLLKG